MDKSRVPSLKKTATYLGLAVDGEPTKLKKDIITEIILCIETLMKDLCAICGDYYKQPNYRCTYIYLPHLQAGMPPAML